jgi:hypothetical protein
MDAFTVVLLGRSLCNPVDSSGRRNWRGRRRPEMNVVAVSRAGTGRRRLVSVALGAQEEPSVWGRLLPLLFRGDGDWRRRARPRMGRRGADSLQRRARPETCQPEVEEQQGAALGRWSTAVDSLEDLAKTARKRSASSSSTYDHDSVRAIHLKKVSSSSETSCYAYTSQSVAYTHRICLKCGD